MATNKFVTNLRIRKAMERTAWQKQEVHVLICLSVVAASDYCFWSQTGRAHCTSFAHVSEFREKCHELFKIRKSDSDIRHAPSARPGARFTGVIPNFDPRRAILEAFGTSSGSRRMISRLLNLDSRKYNFSVICHTNGGLGVTELFEEIKQDDMLSRLTNNRKGTMLTIFIFL